MCTVNGEREVMVCDVSRDVVRDALLRRLGEAARFETVHGAGTRVTCADPDRTAEFQASVRDALGWEEDRFPQ
jgi:DNA-binding FadR family transcriptional regulator